LTRPTLSQALREGNSSEVLLVKIEHPDGDVYLWDGLGVLDYDGHEWQGVSRLGAVQIAPSDTEVQVTDITFTLSGIDEEFVSYLDQTVKGLTAYVWKAFLGPDYRVRFTELLAECALDQPTFLPEPNGKQTMRIVCNGGFYFLENQSHAYWSTEDQRNYLTSLGLDPDSDTGFNLMDSKLKNTQINWEAPD
jgi:hypothetical protein